MVWQVLSIVFGVIWIALFFYYAIKDSKKVMRELNRARNRTNRYNSPNDFQNFFEY